MIYAGYWIAKFRMLCNIYRLIQTKNYNRYKCLIFDWFNGDIDIFIFAKIFGQPEMIYAQIINL